MGAGLGQLVLRLAGGFEQKGVGLCVLQRVGTGLGQIPGDQQQVNRAPQMGGAVGLLGAGEQAACLAEQPLKCDRGVLEFQAALVLRRRHMVDPPVTGPFQCIYLGCRVQIEVQQT